MSKLNNFFNSPKLFKFVIILARVLPRPVILFLARIFINIMMLTSYSALDAIKANLKVILGDDYDEKNENKMVRTVFINQSRYLYDVFHSYSHPDRVLKKVFISEKDKEQAKAFQDKNQGAIIIGPHYGNFDICLIAIGLLGIKAQVLSIANPNADYQIQNDIRQVNNLDVTPISIKSLISASRRLKNGGVVVTAVDRPLPDGEEYYQFFGKPARLPDGHVRLALKHDVPIFILYSKFLGKDYQLMVSEPVFMEELESKEDTIRLNTEKILSLLEEIIKQDPLNWMMFFSVWE